MLADKPSRMVRRPSRLSWRALAFVSRGGDKLAGALDRFAIDVAARIARRRSIDRRVHRLPRNPAAHVVAVDVGHGQLTRDCAQTCAEVHERLNVRTLAPGRSAPSTSSSPTSFISLRAVLGRCSAVWCRQRSRPAREAAVRGGQGAADRGRA
jgi:23S rRNA (cytidine1920-2'-O)/16S rRNA (cytidine1409-2'-O)-methyltransferase